MLVAATELVFDAEVREVDGLIEVRQVVFARPFFDVASVAIRSSVAVRPAAIRLLKPFLILAFEFVVEDDAMDLRALLTEPLFLTQIRAIELDVVRQLTRPADTAVEGLLSGIVAAAAMGLQEVMTAFRQRHGAFA